MINSLITVTIWGSYILIVYLNFTLKTPKKKIELFFLEKRDWIIFAFWNFHSYYIKRWLFQQSCISQYTSCKLKVYFLNHGTIKVYDQKDRIMSHKEFEDFTNIKVNHLYYLGIVTAVRKFGSKLKLKLSHTLFTLKTSPPPKIKDQFLGKKCVWIIFVSWSFHS